MAENIAESLRKGLLVTLSGRLRQRDYDDKDGNKHTVYEINLDAIGPSLRWDRAQIARRPTRDNPSPGAAPAASPWDVPPAPQAPAPSAPPVQPQQGPMPGWGGQPPQQQPQYDNPPF
jgi:single-strand DNA-binding protein